MSLSNLPAGQGDKALKGELCLVWRHARWFVAAENENGGAMFPLNGYKKTEVRFYNDRWGYPHTIKTFRTKESAVAYIKKEILA